MNTIINVEKMEINQNSDKFDKIARMLRGERVYATEIFPGDFDSSFLIVDSEFDQSTNTIKGKIVDSEYNHYVTFSMKYND